MNLKLKKYKYYIKTFFIYIFDNFLKTQMSQNQKKFLNFIEKNLIKNNIKKFSFLRIEAFGYSIIQYLYLLSKGKVLLIYGFEPVNKFLLSKFKKNNLLIKNEKIINYFQLNSNKVLKKFIINTPVNTHNFIFDKKKFFKFSKKEIKYCENLLRLNKVDKKKIITLNYKSQTYWEKKRYIKNHDYYRLSDPKNLLFSANYLKRQGYEVIITNELNKKEKKIFRNFKTLKTFKNYDDILDFYIVFKAEFCIVGASGDQFLARMFDKISLYHNCLFPHTMNRGIFLPKKIYSHKNKKFLSLKQIVDIKLPYYNRDHFYQNLTYLSPLHFRDINFFKFCELEVIENSKEEIFEAMKDLLKYKYRKINLKRTELKIQNNLKKIYFQNTPDGKQNKIEKGFKIMGGYISPSFIKNNPFFIE